MRSIGLCGGQGDAHTMVVRGFNCVKGLGAALVGKCVVLIFSHHHQFNVGGFVGDSAPPAPCMNDLNSPCSRGVRACGGTSNENFWYFSSFEMPWATRCGASFGPCAT